MIQLIDADFDIKFNDDGTATTKHTQNITQEFIDRCRQDYDASGTEKAKDYHKVASVPTVIADQWRREGFDVYRESAKAIVARLKLDNLDYFVTTKKEI